MARHFLSAEDFTKEDLLDVFSRAKAYEEGEAGDKQGKVLGLLFLGESTRTSASLKSAIIRLGGGWYGMEGTKGTYLETGEEDLLDTATSLADFCDVFAIRGNVDPEIFRSMQVPVLNAMMGDDHAISAAWLLYTIWKRMQNLEGLKVGTYGMIRYSRPIKSFYRVWSKFGIKIYEDCLVEGLGCPDEVKAEIEKSGSTIEEKPIEKIMDEVDILIVAEALPQKGADPELVDKFNKKFETVDSQLMGTLNDKAFWVYIQPGKTTDGRQTITDELKEHPRLLQRAFMRESVYCNMGIISKLLD